MIVPVDETRLQAVWLPRHMPEQPYIPGVFRSLTLSAINGLLLL